MADDDKDKGEKEERKPLRRRRAPSVVPNDAGGGEDTSERRKRLFSEPAAPSEAPPPEGVKKKRRWFRVASEPVPPSDLAETEARAEAAKAAATELRSRLKPAEEAPVVEEAPVAPAPAPRRRRGTTELAPPPLWQRHDLLVVLVALLLFAGGTLLHRVVAAPALAPVDELGLQLARPASWLAGRVARPASGLASAASDQPPSKRPRHLVYQSPVAATARLELRISERPATSNLKAALVLGRVSRYGEAFWSSESTDRTIGGRDWVRTQYRYAFKGTPTDAPIIATAIEYATLNGRLMYIVTVHGDEKTARRLESLLVPTLKVDANHPAAVGK